MDTVFYDLSSPIRGWDGWMASLMQWTWTWTYFRRWWGTGRPGMLQSMRSQTVSHDWAIEHHQQHYTLLSHLTLKTQVEKNYCYHQPNVKGKGIKVLNVLNPSRIYKGGGDVDPSTKIFSFQIASSAHLTSTFLTILLIYLTPDKTFYFIMSKISGEINSFCNFSPVQFLLLLLLSCISHIRLCATP